MRAYKPGDPRRTTWNSTTVDELRTMQIDGDLDLIAELIKLFRGDVGAMLSDLTASASRGEFAKVHSIAHRFVGCASSLGAERLAFCAGEFDRAAAAGDLPAVVALARNVADECTRFLNRADAR